MEKSSLFLYFSLLIIGVFFGGIYGVRDISSKSSSYPDTPTLERFQNKREVKAFEQGNYDFYNKLNSKGFNYNEELSLLLQEWEGFGTNNQDKLELLFYQWGYVSPHYALEALNETPFSLGVREYGLTKIFEGWAEKNPEDLAEYYKANRNTLYQSDALSCSMKAWAESDPVGALKFMKSLNMGEIKESFEVIFPVIRETNAMSCEKLLSSLPEKVLEDDAFLKKIAQPWIFSDPENALNWISSLPSDKQKVFSNYETLRTLPPLNSLAEKFNTENSEELVNILHQYPEFMQTEAWMSVCNAIRDKDGAVAAVKWQLEYMPAERIANLRNVDNLYLFYPTPELEAPEVYENLMKEIPSSEASSLALSHLLHEYEGKFGVRHPERILSHFGNAYGDHSLGYGAHGTTLRTWQYDNPKAARKWIDGKKTMLSPEEKMFFEKSLERNKPIMAIDKK